MHPDSLEPDWQQLAGAVLAPPLEVTKAQRKSLSSIGHLVEKFTAACDRLLAKANDGFMPDLQPWMSPLTDHGTCALRGDGLLVCALSMTAEKFQLAPLLLPAPQADTAVEFWKRSHPDKAQALPPLLSFEPSPVNSTLWPALLRLRPLRDFWERELRRSAVENLLDILPNAWLFDPAPLPPGAVIPGLELASWTELAALRKSLRRFVFSSVTGEADNHLSLDETIHHATRHPKILMELTAPTPETTTIFSLYNKNNARVDWLGAIALTHDGIHHHFHRIE